MHTNTQVNLLMTRETASIAIHIPANDERQMQILKIQSDDKTQYRVRLDHLANRYVLKKESMRPSHMESSRQDPKISEVQTLQHSKNELSNGL